MEHALCVVHVGGAATGGKPLPSPAPVMLCAHVRDCTDKDSLVPRCAAVDRRALPGAHRTTPFAANSLLRGKGRHLCACTVAVRAGVRASALSRSIANRPSIVFFVVAVGRGDRLETRNGNKHNII